MYQIKLLRDVGRVCDAAQSGVHTGFGDRGGHCLLGWERYGGWIAALPHPHGVEEDGSADEKQDVRCATVLHRGSVANPASAGYTTAAH